MTRLTIKQKILFTLGLIVAVLLAIIGGIVYPVAKKIYTLQQEINKIEMDLEKRYENSKKLQRTVREIDTITKETEKMAQTMIKAGDELGLITQLENLAEQNHIMQDLEVAFKEIRQDQNLPAGQTGTHAGLTHYYLLTFSNQGEFNDHLEYLTELEKSPFYLITDNIRWEKGKEDKAGKSLITLNFSGIIYVDPTSIKK